jgi:N-acetylglutamate synthase-like GNAT family acetyltransferase
MTSAMTLVEYAHGSAGYFELVRLRDLHLRQPIGLRLRDEDRAGEEGHRHFALVEHDRILGGLIANPLGAGSAKLRQMWIHPDLRGQGHGRELLENVEARLAAGGTRHFMLHARQNAAGFYRKSGYAAVGGIFTEVGRPHQRMEKRLPA